MIVTLSGPNDFLRQDALDKIVADFVVEHSDMALERVDGSEAEFQKIYDALTSLPFLASKKLVVLRSPSVNKEFVEKAETLLKNLSESTELVLIELKFDKRSSLYKLLKKVTDFREFDELDTNSLARWLTERAKEQGREITPPDARFLVERVGLNQQMLASELDKLLLYDSKISRQNIELLSEPTPQSTIFELLDAALAGNSKKALELYDEQRALKVEPLQIVAMLAWQLHVLALIQAAGSRSASQVASEAKLNPYVVNKSFSIAKRLSPVQIKTLVKDLLTLDVRLKSESIDPDEALKFYLLNAG